MSCAEPARDTDGIAVGLLLPFSGTNAGIAANFERAAIYAVERVNAAGGVRGQRLRLVAADTHSNPTRGVASARHLIDEGVVAVLGVESADIAAEVEPMFFAHQIAMISPFVGTADDATVSCDHQWFRLAPSARSLGEALAKQLSAERVQSVAVISDTDAYSQAFGDAVGARFVSLGGRVALRVDVDPTRKDYAAVLTQIVDAGVTEIVLSTSASTASTLVNESKVTFSTPLNWYLSPVLKTPLFLLNAFPGSLDGGKGVAPRLFEEDGAFAHAFEQRWPGDPALEGAYFYYDAVALVAYALEVTLADAPDAQLREKFKTALGVAASQRGTQTGWDEIEQGLAMLEAGRPAYYAGGTGPLVFDKCGLRKLGASSTWGVKRGRIVNDSAL